jgi:hypothetical protein
MLNVLNMVLLGGTIMTGINFDKVNGFCGGTDVISVPFVHNDIKVTKDVLIEIAKTLRPTLTQEEIEECIIE